jgi:hypothetical protein
MKILFCHVFLFIYSIALSQSTLTDYDFTLTLEKVYPTSDCHEKLRLTVGTDGLGSGHPPVYTDFIAIYSSLGCLYQYIMNIRFKLFATPIKLFLQKKLWIHKIMITPTMKNSSILWI